MRQVLSALSCCLCQDETQTLKLKVLELVEENRLLHEEIKRNAVSDILHHGIEVPGVTIALLI